MHAPIPFYVAPGESPARRRVLVISYHFPPSREVGGLRWQKMARHAADRGWGVDVICLDPADLETADPARLDDLPPGTRVYGVSDPQPLLQRLPTFLWKQVRRLTGSAGPAASAGSRARAEVVSGTVRRDWRRAYLAYTYFARQRAWGHRAAKLAERLRGPEHFAVVTSGPPHMVHEAGRIVASRAGLPAVMDMRDPWSLNQRMPDPLATPVYYTLAERYERQTVASARLIVANTEAAAQALRRLHPADAARVITVMNGSDDDPLPPRSCDGSFRVAYAGTIYLDRDPRPLFRAAARVIRERNLGPDDFSIHFAGAVEATGGTTLAQIADAEGIGAYVVYHAPLPRHETLQFLANATMLVSLPQDSDMAIPSKVFEYTRFDAWLLALAEPASATALVLRGSEADVVSPRDDEEIADVLRRRYDAFVRGERPTPVGHNGRFSRRRQAEILFDALETLG